MRFIRNMLFSTGRYPSTMGAGGQQDVEFCRYIEYHDDKLDFKPNFRRITIYTYHPKWIPMPEGAEPIGYEVAYQLSREFKRDIYEKIDSHKNAYADMVTQ